MRVEFSLDDVVSMAGSTFDRLVGVIEDMARKGEWQAVTLIYGSLDGILNGLRSMLAIMRVRTEQDEDRMRDLMTHIEALRDEARQMMIAKGLDVPPFDYPSR